MRYFPALFFSAWSRWLVPKPLASPALASLQCLEMLQPSAAHGSSVLNGSNDVVRVGEHFALAPMPNSHPW